MKCSHINKSTLNLNDINYKLWIENLSIILWGEQSIVLVAPTLDIDHIKMANTQDTTMRDTQKIGVET